MRQMEPMTTLHRLCQGVAGATKDAGPKPANPVTCADLALMERELKCVQRDYYGEDMVNLVIAAGYVTTLIGHRRIER